MNPKRLITIAIAATLLIGGAAAVGAASPADAAAQNATNAPDEPGPDETASDDAGPDVTASDDPGPNETAADADVPSDGLPEQVPDRVSEVHETIDSFLDGSDDGLGGSLSDLLSGDDAADGDTDSAGDGE